MKTFFKKHYHIFQNKTFQNKHSSSTQPVMYVITLATIELFYLIYFSLFIIITNLHIITTRNTFYNSRVHYVINYLQFKIRNPPAMNKFFLIILYSTHFIVL